MAMQLIKFARLWLLKRSFQSVTAFQESGQFEDFHGWVGLLSVSSVVPGKQCFMLPGTERNVKSGVLMLWNGTSGNITHVLCCLGTLYTSLAT